MKIKTAISKMMKYYGVEEKEITNIDENNGTIWFDYNGHTFFLGMDVCE